MINNKLLEYIAGLSYEELLNFIEMKYGQNYKTELQNRIRKKIKERMKKSDFGITI